MISPPPTAARRGGFTLLELLIAISVIALLLALLVPAIRQVMGTANDTAVSSEIKGIEGGLSQFHQMYGTMPPSGIDLRRTTAVPTADGVFINPGTMPALRMVFGTSIDQVAMVRSLNAMGFPGGGAAPGDLNDLSQRGILRGAECLVFFLGGLPANGEVPGPNAGIPSQELAGFSKNPRDPFNATPQAGRFVLLDKGRRAGPFYAFQPDRLRYAKEVEGTAPNDTKLTYFTYIDGFTAQKAPIMYASSDGGRAYEPLHIAYVGGVFDNSDGVSTAFDPDGPTAPRPPRVYLVPDGTPGDLSDNTFINPNGYQIISPGADGEYGTGGTYSSDGGFKSAANASDGGEDNVTNFSAGSLGD